MSSTSTADKRNQRRRIWIGVGVLVVLFAAAASWKWTPLADWITVEKMARWAASLRESPARHFYIIGAYIIGSVLLVPITLLILVTVIVFGPVAGSVYSLIGSLAGALVTYAIGYFLGQDFVRKIAGAKWQRLEKEIGRTGIVAVATLRLLPVAPFTVVNIVSGAFKVPWRDFTLGSLLGLAPGILITSLFAHQFASAIRNPGIGTFLLLAALIAVSVVGAVWLKRRFKNAKA
jgi:phospholipase D1/2